MTTPADASIRSEVAGRRLVTFLRRLVYPVVPEPVSVTQWRRLASLLVWLPLLFVALNVFPVVAQKLGLGESRSGAARHYHVFLAVNLPGHALLIGASVLVLLRGAREAHYRLYGVGVVLLFNWVAGTGMWIGHLTVNFVSSCMLIATARVGFDSRMGLWAFMSATAVVIALFVLDLLGLSPPSRQLLELGSPTRTDRVLALLWEVNLYLWTWITSSWVALRFRQSEHALQLERAEARRQVAHTLFTAGVGRLTGQLLGERYRLEELLGRGGMGEVYAARAADDGREVAVKVLHPHLVDDPSAHERFRREAEAAGKLSATEVAAIHEVGVSAEGEAFIVMERLRGEDLGARMRRLHRLDPREVVGLTRRLAAALDALHGAGIVHRDLKPPNIFLVSGDDGGLGVRLLDFGIARLADGVSDQTLTATGVLVGSPGYLAPEQVTGPASLIGPATDVFALGAILYRALTGVDPFPARHVAGAVYEAVHRHPERPTALCPDLPPAVDDVLALALAKEVAARYGSAGELARDLAAAFDGTLAETVCERARRVRPRESTVTEVARLK
jgi:predicted Ser/Thr protein kinase